MKLKFAAVVALLCACTTVYAQKPSSSQKNSLRAPANIKIDGQLTEWDNKLQAYSNHTQFYYTLSNDSKYLYLTVQAKYQEITTRILKGGITLTINKSNTKTDPDGIHITYPVINHFFIRFNDAPDVKHDGAAALARLDTFVNEVNTRLESRTKFIRVAGIKGVDTLISIYNLDGIKAASHLDNQMHFNYELAVSLMDLGLDIKNPQKFTYQVMINETDDSSSHGSLKNGASGNAITFTITTPATSAQPATDFWGEYTLAR